MNYIKDLEIQDLSDFIHMIGTVCFFISIIGLNIHALIMTFYFRKRQDIPYSAQRLLTFVYDMYYFTLAMSVLILLFSKLL